MKKLIMISSAIWVSLMLSAQGFDPVGTPDPSIKGNPKKVIATTVVLDEEFDEIVPKYIDNKVITEYNSTGYPIKVTELDGDDRIMMVTECVFAGSGYTLTEKSSGKELKKTTIKTVKADTGVITIDEYIFPEKIFSERRLIKASQDGLSRDVVIYDSSKVQSKKYAYTFDKGQHMTGIRIYNNDGKLDGDNSVVNYVYNADGTLKETTYGYGENDVTSREIYDYKDGKLYSIVHTDGGNVAESVIYLYTDKGQVSQEINMYKSDLKSGFAYEYDENGNVKSKMEFEMHMRDGKLKGIPQKVTKFEYAF